MTGTCTGRFLTQLSFGHFKHDVSPPPPKSHTQQQLRASLGRLDDDHNFKACPPTPRTRHAFCQVLGPHAVQVRKGHDVVNVVHRVLLVEDAAFVGQCLHVLGTIFNSRGHRQHADVHTTRPLVLSLGADREADNLPAVLVDVVVLRNANHLGAGEADTFGVELGLPLEHGTVIHFFQSLPIDITSAGSRGGGGGREHNGSRCGEEVRVRSVAGKLSKLLDGQAGAPVIAGVVSGGVVCVAASAAAGDDAAPRAGRKAAHQALPGTRAMLQASSSVLHIFSRRDQ